MVSPFRTRYLQSLALLVAVGCVWAGTATRARSEDRGNTRVIKPYDPNAPTAVAGEVVARLAPGADAQALARQFRVQVKKKLRFAPDTYIFKSQYGGNMEGLVTSLKSTPGVLEASVNHIYLPQAVPSFDADDTLRDRQWALDIVRARKAWGIAVAERFKDGPIQKNVVVSIIDSGILTAHPDLAENVDPNGWDFSLDQPHQDDPLSTSIDGHGTAMAGCAAGVTNNSEGIASLPWEAVKVLPCRINDIVVVNNVAFSVFSAASITDAIYYSIERKVDVINMSLGGLFSDPLMAQACTDAYNQGIVICASSGNFAPFFTEVLFPASLPEVIAVGAVGPTGGRAFYSQGGKDLEIMAPGGNAIFFNDFGSLILMLDSGADAGFATFFGIPEGYTYNEGTSPASAYASGIIATLISQGARDDSLAGPARVEALRRLITRTTTGFTGTRTDEYGWGLINYEAALKASTNYIDLLSPAPGQRTGNQGQQVQAFIRQPIPVPLSRSDFKLIQNGTNRTKEVKIVDRATGEIEYQPNSQTRFLLGSNVIDIQSRSAVYPDAVRSFSGEAVGHIPARDFIFRVEPHKEYPGLRLISVPYSLLKSADTLPFLYQGKVVRMARWLPRENRYALFDTVGSPQDPEASLTTKAAGVKRPPLGLGFWARVSTTTPVQIVGTEETSEFYRIPLDRGYNMIGNPYPFRVPWPTIDVEFVNANTGQTERVGIADAVEQGMMSSAIWRWFPSDREAGGGHYEMKSLPDGELVDWEGHWVRAYRKLTLVVPRLAGVSASAGSANRRMAAAAGGWRASVSAAIDGKAAGRVTVGAAPRARNGFDAAGDVELPPAALAAAPALRIRHGDWGEKSGKYAQDLRAEGVPQRWNLEMETSRPRSVVKVSWSRFPPGTRAFARIDGGAQRPLDPSGSLQFTAPRAGLHRITVVAEPGRTG
jgi:subtilisin family serine protease